MAIRTEQGIVCMPNGVTHWDELDANPFFKIVLTEVSADTAMTDNSCSYRLIGTRYYKDVRCQFIDGVWCECVPVSFIHGEPLFYPQHMRLKKLTRSEYYCGVKRIDTVYGEGFLLGRENNNIARYIVDLDKNPFNFWPVCLFDKDVLETNGV